MPPVAFWPDADFVLVIQADTSGQVPKRERLLRASSFASRQAARDLDRTTGVEGAGVP